MKLKFTIFCETAFGQNLFLNIAQKEIALQYIGDFFWQGEIEIPFATQILYSYFIKNQDFTTILEDREKRCLEVEKNMKNIEIFDEFLFFNNQKPFFTKPFTECYFSEIKKDKSLKIAENLHFKIGRAHV